MLCMYKKSYKNNIVIFIKKKQVTSFFLNTFLFWRGLNYYNNIRFIKLFAIFFEHSVKKKNVSYAKDWRLYIYNVRRKLDEGSNELESEIKWGGNEVK